MLTDLVFTKFFQMKLSNTRVAYDALIVELETYTKGTSLYLA